MSDLPAGAVAFTACPVCKRVVTEWKSGLNPHVTAPNVWCPGAPKNGSKPTRVRAARRKRGEVRSASKTRATVENMETAIRETRENLSQSRQSDRYKNS